MWTVKTRYHELKVSIVEPGRLERWWAIPGYGEYPLAWGAVDKPYHTHFTKREQELQRRDLMNRMQKAVKEEIPGVKLLSIRELLQETLDAWRDDPKRLEKTVLTCFHKWDRARIEKLIGSDYRNVTANQLIGCDDPPLIKDSGEWKIGIRPTPWIQNVSEEGWMTDKGWIYNNKKTWWRSREDEITHAIMENHPEIAENIEVLLEPETPAFIEGGDIRAQSEDTMSVGIGWHTNHQGMLQISKALPEKTIYAVQKVPILAEGLNDMVYTFAWHLGTFHCEVDEGMGMFMPYVMDYPEGGRKRYIDWVKALKRDIEEYHPLLQKLREEEMDIPKEQKDRIKAQALQDLTDENIALLEDMGKVYTYKAGERISTRNSYIQALIDDGVIDSDGIIWYGGDPNQYENALEHLSVISMEIAAQIEMPEPLKPGVLVMSSWPTKTIESLEEHGVKCVTYDDFYEKKFGGPAQDCAFCPLHRE